MEGGNEEEVRVRPEPVEGFKSACLDDIGHRAGSIAIHLQRLFTPFDLVKGLQIFRIGVLFIRAERHLIAQKPRGDLPVRPNGMAFHQERPVQILTPAQMREETVLQREQPSLSGLVLSTMNQLVSQCLAQEVVANEQTRLGQGFRQEQDVRTAMPVLERLRANHVLHCRAASLPVLQRTVGHHRRLRADFEFPDLRDQELLLFPQAQLQPRPGLHEPDGEDLRHRKRSDRPHQGKNLREHLLYSTTEFIELCSGFLVYRIRHGA